LQKKLKPKVRQYFRYEDLVFSDNFNVLLARDNEESVWRQLVINLGFTGKYKNGRLKKFIFLE